MQPPDASCLVLALNPSIDVEWRVDQVIWEEKNTIQSERRWAGGKGVNVARWARHLGDHPLLLLPLGGNTGREMTKHLRRENLPAATIPLTQSTRANIIITTSSQRQLRFNPRGPKLSSSEWQAVFQKVKRLLRQAKAKEIRPADSCLILSGSLPRGASPAVYARLVRLGHEHNIKTLLDCDGPAFAAAVKAGPFLVKPNEHELAQWWGHRFSSDAGLLRAARQLSDITRGWVLVSRGSRGALLVHQGQGRILRAGSPSMEPVNTIGAGDALLAAVARQIGRHAPPEEWLRWGVATGTAATQCAAGCLPSRTLIRQFASRIRLPPERIEPH